MAEREMTKDGQRSVDFAKAIAEHVDASPLERVVAQECNRLLVRRALLMTETDQIHEQLNRLVDGLLAQRGGGGKEGAW